MSEKKYSLELRDSAGDLLDILHNARDINHTEVLNGTPTLSFNLPIEEGTKIDVGCAAIDRSGSVASGITLINKGNPANTTGTIDIVKIYALINLTGCKVATFYKTGALDLKCRDVETIGNVTAGIEQTFSGLSLAVQIGDYIGIYYATGYIESATTGGVAVWVVADDHCIVDDEATYTKYDNYIVSLYGIGIVPWVGGEVVKPNEIWLKDYEEGSIDMGSAATDRASSQPHSYTRIDGANPTNASGIITAVDVWVKTELEDCSIGIFYKTNGATFRCRSVHDEGVVAVGAQTLDVRLAVEEGDYIGIYYSAGEIESDAAGGTRGWVTVVAGNWCTLDNEQDYISEEGRNFSLWGRGIAVVKRFRITSRRDIRQSNTLLIAAITTESYLNQLADEYLAFAYSAEEKTLSEIIDDLLAFQAITPAITRGSIEPGGLRSIQMAEGDTILRALYRLRDSVGGYIYVDTEKKLQWLDDIGEDKGQQIRYRKNLTGMECEIDYTAIANRIYAYGQGSGIDRVELDVKQLEYNAASLTILRGSENAPEEQTEYGIAESLYTGSRTRAGQRVTITNRVVTSLSFPLCKRLAGGQESADVWFRIRAVDDDEILNEKKWGGSGALVTDPDVKWEKVIFDTPVNINEEVRLLVEFVGGSSQRCVYYHREGAPSVKADEVFTEYIPDNGGWEYNDEADQDGAYIYEYTSTEATLRRVGQKLTPSDKDIYKLAFPLAKVGSPTGNITFTVRKVSNDSIIASKVLCDASELTTDLTWFFAVFLPENVDEEVRISVEFGGGNDDNYVVIPRTTSSVIADECYANYSIDAGWVDNTDYDTPYIYAWVIEDATSQAAYGVCPKLLTNTDMTDYDSLAAWAAIQLEEQKNPRQAYRIDSVDLAAQEGFDFEALQIGSQVQIIEEELGIDVNLRVVKIVHSDLLHPERMTVEVANRVRDIADTLTALEAA